MLFRGFLSLSDTLGKLAVALHDGLLQTVAAETDLPVLAALLRTLHALANCAPYPRLPPTLLPRIMLVGSGLFPSQLASKGSSFCNVSWSFHYKRYRCCHASFES